MGPLSAARKSRRGKKYISIRRLVSFPSTSLNRSTTANDIVTSIFTRPSAADRVLRLFSPCLPPPTPKPLTGLVFCTYINYRAWTPLCRRRRTKERTSRGRQRFTRNPPRRRRDANSRRVGEGKGSCVFSTATFSRNSSVFVCRPTPVDAIIDGRKKASDRRGSRPKRSSRNKW